METLKIVTFNEGNPKCPKCTNHYGSDYRCKYCNCNMHWFCTVDQSDGSELGHGAHYVCSNCGPKKMTSGHTGSSNASSAGNNSIPVIQITSVVQLRPPQNLRSQKRCVIKQWELILPPLPPNLRKNQVLVVRMLRMVAVLFLPQKLLEHLEQVIVNLLLPPNLPNLPKK